MQAQSAAGNDAEALRTYERCRALLAEELGAYPSPETEAVYLDMLRSSREALLRRSISLTPTASQSSAHAISEPPKRDRHKLAALIAGLLLLVVGAAGVAFVLASDDEAPPEVLPNSVVRIDPDTLEPAQVVRVGDQPDTVVIAGGFVWVAHRGRSYAATNALHNSGDRTLIVSTRRRGTLTSSGRTPRPVGVG